MTSSVLGIDTNQVKETDPRTGKEKITYLPKTHPKTAKDELVYLPKSSRLQGTYIIGATGAGKSGLLENLIIQDIRQGIGVCVLDPHGDLIRKVLARLDKDRVKDVIFLDAEDTDYNGTEYYFGINLYQCDDPANNKFVTHTYERVEHIFDLLWGENGKGISHMPLVSQGVRNSAYTFIDSSPIYGCGMLEVPLLFREKVPRENMVTHLRDDTIRSYWLDYYATASQSTKDELARMVVNKIEGYTTNRLLKPIIGQSKTTIHFRDVMDQGKILLVQLPGEHEEMLELLGAMIIAQILGAALSRKEIHKVESRKQFHIYCDEFELYATEDFTRLLKECRKYGMAVTIAHQSRDFIDLKNKAASLQVANLIVLRVIRKDADELAGNFDCTPIRTKKIQKMRTEPVYKEWDEYVWTDEEAHAEYDQLPHLFYEAERKSGQKRKELSQLAAAIQQAFAANDPYYHSIDFDTCDTGILELLLNNKPPPSGEYTFPKKTWDELFVPPEEYFDYGIRRDKSEGLATRSGLVKLGKPIVYGLNDIYTEEEIWQYQEHRRFHKEHFLFFSWLIENENIKSDIPLFLRQGGTVSVYEEGYILRPEAVDKVRLVWWMGRFPELKQELRELLLPLYAQKIWWFVSDPHCVEMDNSIQYSIEDPKARNRIKRRDWIDQASSPPLGRERDGKSSGSWSLWGKWDTTHTFPEAVAWLREKVASLMDQASEEEKYWSAEAKRLRERRDRLEEQCYISVHHKDYLGEQPVKDQQVTDLGHGHSRYGRVPMTRTTDVQWYDLVEELDQTPAERRDEIAGEIAMLPDHVARVKIKGENDQFVEYTIRTLKPDRGLPEKAVEERIAQIKATMIGNKIIRPKLVIDEEIKKRHQALWRPPLEPPYTQEFLPPPDNEPPISRRQRG